MSESLSSEKMWLTMRHRDRPLSFSNIRMSCAASTPSWEGSVSEARSREPAPVPSRASGCQRARG